jgi:methionine-rich copper-binding protein CopC
MFTFQQARGTIAIATAVLAAAAVPAFGHAAIKTRTPAPGSTSANVSTVSISFKEAVVTGRISVTHNGTAVTAKSSGLNPKKTVVVETFSKKLAAGTYTVNWRVKADDGHTEKGTWMFTAR